MASKTPTSPIPRITVSHDAGALGHSDPLLERIAWLMDNSIGIPGTRRRIGLDPLLGLFPGLGDLLGAGVQIALMTLALTRYKVPRAVAARMAANILLDMGVGAVPLVGDLFDLGFKANTRNVRLLRNVEEQRRQGQLDAELNVASRRYLLFLGMGLGAGLLLMFVGAIALVAWVIRWAFS